MRHFESQVRVDTFHVRQLAGPMAMGMWGKATKIRRYILEEPDLQKSFKKAQEEMMKAFGGRKVAMTREELLAKRGIKPPPPLGSKKK